MAPKRSNSANSSASTSKKVKTEPQGRVSGQFKAASKAAPKSQKKSGSALPPTNKAYLNSGPALVLNDEAWDGVYNDARKEMGGKVAIHGDVNNVNRIDDVLRVFDLSYKYGPATGMSRLDRWNRAEELGLDPPVEVKNILLTREGLNDGRYRESYATQAGV